MVSVLFKKDRNLNEFEDDVKRRACERDGVCLSFLRPDVLINATCFGKVK